MRRARERLHLLTYWHISSCTQFFKFYNSAPHYSASFYCKLRCWLCTEWKIKQRANMVRTNALPAQTLNSRCDMRWDRMSWVSPVPAPYCQHMNGDSWACEEEDSAIHDTLYPNYGGKCDSHQSMRAECSWWPAGATARPCHAYIRALWQLNQRN